MAQIVKNLPAMQKTQVQSLDWSPGEGNRLPIPVFLPGEFCGQRSLPGYSPCDHNSLDTTEQLTHYKIKFIRLIELQLFFLSSGTLFPKQILTGSLVYRTKKMQSFGRCCGNRLEFCDVSEHRQRKQRCSEI